MPVKVDGLSFKHILLNDSESSKVVGSETDYSRSNSINSLLQGAVTTWRQDFLVEHWGEYQQGQAVLLSPIKMYRTVSLTVSVRTLWTILTAAFGQWIRPKHSTWCTANLSTTWTLWKCTTCRKTRSSWRTSTTTSTLTSSCRWTSDCWSCPFVAAHPVSLTTDSNSTIDQWINDCDATRHVSLTTDWLNDWPVNCDVTEQLMCDWMTAVFYWKFDVWMHDLFVTKRLMHQNWWNDFSISTIFQITFVCGIFSLTLLSFYSRCFVKHIDWSVCTR